MQVEREAAERVAAVAAGLARAGYGSAAELFAEAGRRSHGRCCQTPLIIFRVENHE